MPFFCFCFLKKKKKKKKNSKKNLKKKPRNFERYLIMRGLLGEWRVIAKPMSINVDTKLGCFS
jgi:hypothetical protein